MSQSTIDREAADLRTKILETDKVVAGLHELADQRRLQALERGEVIAAFAVGDMMAVANSIRRQIRRAIEQTREAKDPRERLREINARFCDEMRTLASALHAASEAR